MCASPPHHRWGGDHGVVEGLFPQRGCLKSPLRHGAKARRATSPRLRRREETGSVRFLPIFDGEGAFPQRGPGEGFARLPGGR